MFETGHTDTAKWEVHPDDDPVFLGQAERIVAAAAVFAQQRNIVVVRIDNWFGVRWLGFPMRRFRIRGGLLGGFRMVTKLREPTWYVPPFHPHRVLSETRFEMIDGGIVRGPFEPSRPLHQLYRLSTRPRPMLHGERSFAEARERGVYAWCSGNTKANDRAALMVYIRSNEGTSGWYAEFRKVDSWRLSRRTGIGDADWRRLLEIGGVKLDD